MFRKTTINIIMAVLIVHLTTICAFAASDVLGFIDTQKVLMAHPKYVASQKQIDAFVKKKSDAAKAAVEKEKDQKKQSEIIDKARTESAMEEVRIMNPLTKDINDAIEKVAKSKGVTVVLNRIMIYYGGTDLTDDVVKVLKNLK